MALIYFEFAISLSSLKGNKRLLFSFEYIYIEINQLFYIYKNKIFIKIKILLNS